MNIKKIYILPVILFFTLAFVSGCSDSTTSPTQNNSSGNVNGKVTDVNGFPIGGATVLIGSTIATSGADGSFTINSVTAPYNLKVLVGSGSTPTGAYYQGLTSFSPQIFAGGTSGVSSSTALSVTIPVLGVDQRAVVIFTDNANVHTSMEISSPTVTANLNVKWVSGSSINGKIIVLVYTFVAGQISAFNKYGETNITLVNGSPANVTITSAQLSVTPQNSTISGTLSLPSGYTTPKSLLVLKFGTGNIANGAIIGNEIMGTTFNFVVPAVLTSSVRIGIQGQASGSTGEYTFKYDTVQAGSSGKVITLESAPGLTTPPNGQTAVDTATNFSYSAGSGTGIYIVIFNGTGRTFAVFTNSTSATIPNFSSIGLGIGTNVNYTWSVQKYNVSSVNDLVTGPISTNAVLTSTAISATRTFVTGP